MDRGYVDFNVDSTRSRSAPTSARCTSPPAIKEGEVYTVSDIKLTGDADPPKKTCASCCCIKAGDRLLARADRSSRPTRSPPVLSNIGYAFAEVQPIPTIDREKREVGLNFFVNPGKRVYVRRIIFKGNAHTEDEVCAAKCASSKAPGIRRPRSTAPRSACSAWATSRPSTIDTPKVPGTEDQVDVVVTVEEQNSGSFTFGLGYSQVQGLIASVVGVAEQLLRHRRQASASRARAEQVHQALRVQRTSSRT